MVDSESTRGSDDAEADGRTTYLELKEWFLGNYYDCCRDRGTRLKWSRRQVLSDIHSDFVSSFSKPIEVFLVHVIALIMTSGWDDEEAAYYRGQALEQLKKLSDVNFDDALGENEKDELFRDLRVMGFMVEGGVIT